MSAAENSAVLFTRKPSEITPSTIPKPDLHHQTRLTRFPSPEPHNSFARLLWRRKQTGFGVIPRNPKTAKQRTACQAWASKSTEACCQWLPLFKARKVAWKLARSGCSFASTGTDRSTGRLTGPVQHRSRCWRFPAVDREGIPQLGCTGVGCSFRKRPWQLFGSASADMALTCFDSSARVLCSICRYRPWVTGVAFTRRCPAWAFDSISSTGWGRVAGGISLEDYFHLCSKQKRIISDMISCIQSDLE